MKKFSITALSLLLMLFFVSCSDDDDGGDNDNRSNSFLPNIGSVQYFEGHNLDKNNNEIDEPIESKQTVINKIILLGKEAIVIEDYNSKTGERDTIYLSEDSDFLYIYIDENDFETGGDGGDLSPTFEMEPQWSKMFSFTQYEWTAIEQNYEVRETEIPFNGINYTVEMSMISVTKGKKSENQNFTIREKNETIETIINELTTEVKIEFKLKGGLPMPFPMPATEQSMTVKYSIAKGFGIVQFLLESQEVSTGNSTQIMNGNLSKMVDYK